jgi:hypothetical protein
MRPDYSVIDRVCDGYIICCRGKLPRFVKINTIPFNYSIVIVDSGIFNEVATLYFGIVKTTLTVYFIGIPCNCGRTI